MHAFCERSKFFWTCLLLLALLLPAAGCSKDGTVSGKVYYKGKLVTRGSISIYPDGKGGAYSSPIGTDGSYSVSKVPSGPAKIGILVGMKGPPPNLPSMAARMPRAQGVAAKGMKQQQAHAKAEGADTGNASEDKEIASLPEKYSKPDESGLTINVTGGNQTHDIKIE